MQPSYCLRKKINKLEPLHSKYLQALPLASKFDECISEVVEFENTIASAGASLNISVSNHEVLSKEFKESELNETIQQLDELGKTASSITEAVKQKNRNLQKMAKELRRWNPFSSK